MSQNKNENENENVNAIKNETQGGTLVCAATREELACFGLDDAHELEAGRLWQSAEATLAVTGVGIPHTLLSLPPLLETLRPTYVVNIGIAGAYPDTAPSGAGELAVGEIVLGTSEVFADLGMEIPDAERFRPLGAFAFADAALRAPLLLHVPEWARGPAAGKEVKRGRGATVNACTGTLATGALRRRLFDADFETMEGAAVALACGARAIPVMEVRAISNRAARRDLRPENIHLAFGALASFWAKHRDHIRTSWGTP